MKKIILLACCMLFFSIGVCNADSDIDKLKGCWRSLGIEYKIGDNYYKKLSNDDTDKISFESTDTHILIKRYVEEIGEEDIFYINKESITDTSFMRSNKASSPEDGVKFSRIQCPK